MTLFADKGVLLTISARTLAGHNLPLAFACVNTESSENMKNLHDLMVGAGVDINKPEYILLSDRGTAILKFIRETMNNVTHMLCQRHLFTNLTPWRQHSSLYWNAARYIQYEAYFYNNATIFNCLL
jgi:hypothetical protein